MRRSFVNSIFNEQPPALPPIRANIWTSAAAAAEARRAKAKTPEDREFWHRLAGSLRKASQL